MSATPYLCRPFMIFEGCLDSNPEYCSSKLLLYRLSHPSLLLSHPSLLLSHPSLLLNHPSLFLYDLSDLSFFKFSIKITYGKVLREHYFVYVVSTVYMVLFMPMPMFKYSSVAVNAVTDIDFTKGFYWVFVLYSSSIFISNLCKPWPPQSHG